MIKKNEIKVLIVDDDSQILDTISSLLKEVGYSTITCESAKDALALVKKESFNIVLTDNKMREISGLELLEKIKEINAEIPVILMTGYADLDSAINAIKKGAFDFITKPFIPEHLIQSLEKAVKYHNLIMIERNYKNKLELTNKELKNHHDRLEELVTERTNDLNERVQELERFYEMSVGREVKMIELKSKISQLESELSGYKKKSDNNQLQA